MVKLGEERTALAAFAVMSILAGANGVAIRFSNRELAPLWGAALRFSLAAALLALAMAVLRQRLPRGRALGGAPLVLAASTSALCGRPPSDTIPT